MGHSKRIRNLLDEVDNNYQETVQVFDYHFIIQAGNTAVPLAQTVFVVNSKYLDLPQFRIYPKTKFRKWMDRMNWSKKKELIIDNHKFNTLYNIKTEEASRVTELMNEKILFMLNAEKNLCVEGINYFLIVYRFKKFLSIELIGQFYKTGLALYKSLRVE
jgi:hypothetical protein